MRKNVKRSRGQTLGSRQERNQKRRTSGEGGRGILRVGWRGGIGEEKTQKTVRGRSVQGRRT